MPSNSVRQLGQLSTRRRLHPAKSGARSIRAIDVDTIQKNGVWNAVHPHPLALSLKGEGKFFATPHLPFVHSQSNFVREFQSDRDSSEGLL